MIHEMRKRILYLKRFFFFSDSSSSKSSGVSFLILSRLGPPNTGICCLFNATNRTYLPILVW